MKNVIASALLGLFVVVAPGSVASSQEKQPPPAKGPEPTFKDVRYGPHERNVLDFWKADSKQPTPLLMSIHGGGFTKGNKNIPFLIAVMRASFQYSATVISSPRDFASTKWFFGES